MSKVSRSALAVILAAHRVSWVNRRGLAAAIRAAVQECLPIESEPNLETLGKTIDFGIAWALWDQRMKSRMEMLMLAEEVDTCVTQADACRDD